MTAIALNFADPTFNDWRRIEDKVHLWRGSCIDWFTKAEMSVSATLIDLREHFDKKICVKQGYLFGQKLAVLRETLGQPQFRQMKTAKKAMQSLDSFMIYADLRNDICHGDMTVYMNRQGLWMAQFTLICLGGATVDTRQMAMDEAKASETVKSLGQKVQSLSQSLGNFREAQSGCTGTPVTPSAPAAQGSR